ncbi:MAG TPA: signal peptidase II [Candidatus Ruthenibacterium avium]|uniref:Lipoprotein signal peptidase n=1 Tax=Candidatus Ruthenibacterium avium TaxID=2838751 RepID=A0A9D2S0V8_9FIRM|nr:signal peptidase II [Candidatus Ruthenibacterium avium]
MLIWSVLGILGCVVLDQLTKYFAQLYLQPVGTMPFIPGIMELRFVLNDGAAFSSFAGARLFLILFTGIAIAALAVYLFWKKPPKRLERTALVLLIGGGLGNLIDRVRTGVVVDFFATTFVDFAVFNVADCFVCVGAAMLILYVFLEERKKSGEPERKGSETEHGTS